MAIRDLLWACPLCKGEAALKPGRGGERCIDCGTLYSRGRRALIRARLNDGSSLTQSAAEWMDRLPELGLDERVGEAGAGTGVLHSERVLLRRKVGTERAAFRGVYLNQIERFGPRRAGILQLELDRLTFEAESRDGEGPEDTDDGQRGGALVWSFDAINALQPSSRTLQINASGLPLVSIEVPDGSIRFWELLLTATLQRYYRREGRGEIIEFQPRISTRSEQ